jgi:hypothetical protein
MSRLAVGMAAWTRAGHGRGCALHRGFLCLLDQWRHGPGPMARLSTDCCYWFSLPNLVGGEQGEGSDGSRGVQGRLDLKGMSGSGQGRRVIGESDAA